MAEFLIILKEVSSLFIAIILGYIAGKRLGVERLSIASLLFYLISPLVFFQAVSRAPFELKILVLPLLLLSIASLVSISTYKVAQKFSSWDHADRAMLSFSVPNGNVGYFLFPVVWSLLDEELVNIFIVMSLSSALYENTVGYFIVSRGSYNASESVKKILTMPSIHAFILGVIFSASDFLQISPMFDEFFNRVRGTYSILGMMMIGLGLAQVKNLSFDYKFIFTACTIKFLIYPLVVLLFIYCDMNFLHIYPSEIHQLMVIFTVAPLAANSIVIASLFDYHPEKMAVTVLISTIFALFWVPFVLQYIL